MREKRKRKGVYLFDTIICIDNVCELRNNNGIDVYCYKESLRAKNKLESFFFFDLCVYLDIVCIELKTLCFRVCKRFTIQFIIT